MKFTLSNAKALSPILAMILAAQNIALSAESVFIPESAITPAHAQVQQSLIPPPPPIPKQHKKNYAQIQNFFNELLSLRSAFAVDFDEASLTYAQVITALQSHPQVSGNPAFASEMGHYIDKLSTPGVDDSDLAGHYTKVLANMQSAGVATDPKFRKLVGAARAYENTVNRTDATDVEKSRQYNEIAKHYYDQVKGHPDLEPVALDFKNACKEWATAIRKGNDPSVAYQKMLDAHHALTLQYADHVDPSSTQPNLQTAANLAGNIQNQINTHLGAPSPSCFNFPHTYSTYRFYDSRSPGYYMSNFYSLEGKPGKLGTGIVIGGESWPTSEHYFQACRFPKGSSPYNAIKAARGARKAFEIANDPSFKSQKDDSKKIDCMCEAVYSKFAQHIDLQSQLCSDTGNGIIEEDSGHNDGYWGNGVFVGQQFDAHGKPIDWTDPEGRLVKPNGQLAGVKRYSPGVNNKLGEILMSVRHNYCGVPMPSPYGVPIVDLCQSPQTPPTSLNNIPLNHGGAAAAQYYTINYHTPGGSYSDHAPVIFGNTGTWNIAYQGEFNKKGNYYNHKFQGLTTENDTQYGQRITRISNAIGMMMAAPTGPKVLLLQELPKLLKPPKPDFNGILEQNLKAQGLSYERRGTQGIVYKGTPRLPPTQAEVNHFINYVTSPGQIVIHSPPSHFLNITRLF